jgi:hypothetical protein
MPKPINPEEYAKTGTEHAHQVALFIWAAQNFDKYPVLRYLFAVPNGGERNLKVAANLKAEGVKRGVPDIILPVPIAIWHGLFIELKRPTSENKRKGRVDDEQEKWHGFLLAQGYGVITCYGWKEAADCIIQYLEYKEFNN